MTTQRQPLAAVLGTHEVSHTWKTHWWDFLKGTGKKGLEAAVPLWTRYPVPRSSTPRALQQSGGTGGQGRDTPGSSCYQGRGQTKRLWGPGGICSLGPVRTFLTCNLPEEWLHSDSGGGQLCGWEAQRFSWVTPCMASHTTGTNHFSL